LNGYGFLIGIEILPSSEIADVPRPPEVEPTGVDLQDGILETDWEENSSLLSSLSLLGGLDVLADPSHSTGFLERTSKSLSWTRINSSMLIRIFSPILRPSGANQQRPPLLCGSE
jgi:hypothetical protein